MRSLARLKARLFSCLGIGLVLVACIGLGTTGLTWYHLVYRHERAYQIWKQRKPAHYLYTVQVHSNFWTTQVQIEMRSNKIIGTIDLQTGQKADFFNMVPGSYLHETSTIWGYLRIDDLFNQIHIASKPSRTMKSLVARINPGWYYAAAMHGWVDYGWMGCEMAYPDVEYNPIYGYPERVLLSGNACSSVIELHSPVVISIDSFQVLP